MLCPACNVEKAPEAYSKDKHTRSGYSWSCRECRNAFRRNKSVRPTAPERTSQVAAPAPKPFPPPLPPLESARKAHVEGRQKRDLLAEHKALNHEVERLQKTLDAMMPLRHSNPVAIPPARPPVKGEAVPLILMSDWHVEERVDSEKMHGVNEYNLEIAKARAQRFFENSLRLVNLAARDSTINRVVVGLLGDLISGSIHPELMEINELGPQPAARFAKDLIVGGIQFWLDNSDLDFEINCVGGNHGRMTEKTRIATNAENSLETFAYYFLAAEFKNEPRVKFRVAPGDMIYSNVFPDFRVRFIHGDQIGYGGGVGGVTIPLNKWIGRQDNSIRADLTCLGHFHQFFDGGRFLLNGSLIGASPYSQRFGFSPEPPQQAFALIHSRNGGCKSLVAPIWVDEEK